MTIASFIDDPIEYDIKPCCVCGEYPVYVNCGPEEQALVCNKCRRVISSCFISDPDLTGPQKLAKVVRRWTIENGYRAD